MNSELYITSKINTIKENKSYGILIEVGVGCPIYNELCMHPNTASKIVMYSESPNSWEYNKFKYNHIDIRAISPEICFNFIDHIIENNKATKIPNFNYILVNTIQVSNDNNTQTHGWFGLYYNNIIKYYHFTIYNNTKKRQTLSKIITEIGLDILASENDITKLNNGYIDLILDNDFNQLHEETLISINNGKIAKKNINNTTIVFTQENKIIRFNEYLRSIQNSKLVVFKGSFNPIHQQHINLINEAKTFIKPDNIVLCISICNRDKNKKINIDNLIKRIKILNELGYIVIVDIFGEYHYSYTSFIHNVDFKNIDLNYIMGTDIIKRFLTDEYVYNETENKFIDSFNIKWTNCKFYYFKRGEDININTKLNNIYNINITYDDVSSTEIRKHILSNNFDILTNIVGQKLANLYIKYNIK